MNRFFERYDELDYYCRENRTQNSLHNLDLLQKIIIVTGIFYFLIIPTKYIVTHEFHSSWVYMILYALLGIYYLMIKVLPARFGGSVTMARIICYSFYFLLMVTVDILDIVLRTGQTPLYFPLTMISIGACFVDMTIPMFLFQVICVSLFPIIELILLGSHFNSYDIIVSIFTLFLTQCYSYTSLGIQADSNADSRSFRRKSMNDLLTGLLNKIAFETETKEFLNRRDPDTCCSLIILDFDNFKNVNDSYGHQVGDDVLKEFAHILTDSFREKDLIGRVGGDEFMVTVVGEVPLESLNKRCENIQHRLNTLRIDNAGPFSCSIGVAVDENGCDFATLYNTADKALYNAKENGKSCHVISHT